MIAIARIIPRRKTEVLISEGRIAANGETIAELGCKVKHGGLIEAGDKATKKGDKVYFLMNRPKHTMCTSDDGFGRRIVVGLVDCRQRILTAGRLGYDTSGAVILTSDGDFVNEIIRPQYYISKVYNLTINGILTPEDMKRIKAGIVLGDGIKALSAKYRMMEKGTERDQCSSDLTIVGDRNRQIKCMIEVLGYRIRRPHRSGFVLPHCSDLRQREYHVLRPFGVKQLRNLAQKGKMKQRQQSLLVFLTGAAIIDAIRICRQI